MRNIIPTASDINPTAQTVKLCADGSTQYPTFSEILGQVNRISIDNKQLYRIAFIQLIGGLRISEVLKIRHKDIMTNSNIIIRASKGSNDKLISYSFDYDFFINCKRYMIDPFEGLSRYYVYREYKKRGLYSLFGDNVNCSVTHFFRHLAVIHADSVGISRQDKALITGHKNTSNIKYYEK